MFSKIFRALVLFFSLVALQNAHAGLLDSGFSAEYDVYKNEMYLGITTRTLIRASADSVEFRSQTVPKGIVSLFVSDKLTEVSQMKIKQNQFIPMLYTFDQTGGKKEKHYKIEFDWQKDRLLSTYDNKTHSIKAGTQELLGFQLQLMMDLLNGKQTVRYDIASRKEVESYILKKTGQETTSTENSEYKTIKIESNVTKKGRKYIFWCAESINYLPVKVMRVDDDGDEIVLVLKTLKL